MAGLFISLEGVEGAGKTTLIQKMVAYFGSCGKEVLLTREPGGSELGKKLRGIILNAEEKICPTAELLLFLADRAEHTETCIAPALAQGKIVLCDRFIDSTVAYQGYGRGMDIDRLNMLNARATYVLKPDLTILLDLDPEIGLARATARNIAQNLTVSEGRFEAEALEFHQKIRTGFLTISRREKRFWVVNAAQDADAVFADVLKALECLLEEKESE